MDKTLHHQLNHWFSDIPPQLAQDFVHQHCFLFASFTTYDLSRLTSPEKVFGTGIPQNATVCFRLLTTQTAWRETLDTLPRLVQVTVTARSLQVRSGPRKHHIKNVELKKHHEKSYNSNMNCCVSSNWSFGRWFPFFLLTGVTFSSSRSIPPKTLIADSTGNGSSSSVSPKNKNNPMDFSKRCQYLEETNLRRFFFFEVMRILHRFCWNHSDGFNRFQKKLAGGFILLNNFTPIPGKMIQFDIHFSTGLEPPTRKSLMTHFDTNENVTIEAPGSQGSCSFCWNVLSAILSDQTTGTWTWQ